MANPGMFSFTKCTVVEEGSIIYQKGEQILRTTIQTDDPERHTKLAKITCNLLNHWHSGGEGKKKSSDSGPQVRQSEKFDKEWLDALLSSAADHGSLSTDNHAFVNDMTERLDKWGDRLFISKAQMNYLQVIEDKIA